MFWKKKQPKIKCEHDWHELKLRSEYEHCWPIWETNHYADIYCPKCDKHNTIYQNDWILIKKAQEIKRNYT